MREPVTCYREFEPCEALKEFVRAFFSFVPGRGEDMKERRTILKTLFTDGDPFAAPMFADGRASLVFALGMVCQENRVWREDPGELRGTVVGPAGVADPEWSREKPAMIGAYFHAARFSCFADIPASELTDKVVAAEDVWGRADQELPARLVEMSESARIDHLESMLLRRLGTQRQPNASAKIARLAAYTAHRRGQVTVEHLADAAGISRQHLTRLFREYVGVSPKLFCRIARFQSALVYAGCGKNVNWAEVAVELGYSDQSHMIAEFREFSTLTPHRLGTEPWFHPFIERSKAIYLPKEAPLNRTM
jgi:AraC-like DNA-binding protein